MSQFRTILAASAAFFTLAGAATAAPVTIRDNPNNGASVFATGLGRNVSITDNGVNRTVGAGVFSLQYETGAGWTDFLTFCLQLDEWLSLPKSHDRVDGAGYFPDAADNTALGVLYGNLMTSSTGLKNSTTAAALQTIIWEIAEDGASNFDLSGGAFKLNSTDVLAEANSLWAMTVSGNFKPIAFDVFTANGTQDLLVSEVPLPGAALLFGSALAGFSFSRRRRKSAN
ncbi:MAG: VPLPA-CTERM sorting domain-containing protein [Parvularculaceae bacterium]